MFVFGNFLFAAAKILDVILTIYMWIIIIRALLSWVSPDPYNPIVRFLNSVTDPVLWPIRKAIGYRLGPIDISPMIVILAILFLKYFIVQSLIDFAYKLKGGIAL